MEYQLVKVSQVRRKYLPPFYKAIIQRGDLKAAGTGATEGEAIADAQRELQKRMEGVKGQ